VAIRANPSLAALTGGRYRIALEESWQHERPEVRNPDKLWIEQIPCRGGAFICLYSLKPLILQLYTPRVKNAKTIWEAIKDIPEARPDFHFVGEAVLHFPLEAVHTVAHLSGARKKRRLSEAHKAKLVEANQAYRFKPKINASNATEMTPI
jgi:hypothetical protein